MRKCNPPNEYRYQTKHPISRKDLSRDYIGISIIYTTVLSSNSTISYLDTLNKWRPNGVVMIGPDTYNIEETMVSTHRVSLLTYGFECYYGITNHYKKNYGPIIYIRRLNFGAK